MEEEKEKDIAEELKKEIEELPLTDFEKRTLIESIEETLKKGDRAVRVIEEKDSVGIILYLEELGRLYDRITEALSKLSIPEEAQTKLINKFDKLVYEKEKIIEKKLDEVLGE
jgi:hypothetical protein